MWLTLAAMTASASMILVDQTAVPLAIPHAIDDLNGNLEDGQWILTANILPLAAFMVLGGEKHRRDLQGFKKAVQAQGRRLLAGRAGDHQPRHAEWRRETVYGRFVPRGVDR